MSIKNKKKNPALIIGVVILSIMFFVVVWGNILARLFGSIGSSQNTFSPYGSIDVVYVQGTIGGESGIFGEETYNHQWTLSVIDNLMNSERNKAILLYINSPGGGVYESDELYLKLKEYKEVTKRPVYAYMAQMATSGGYYIAMAADKIYANRMTMTGSIGVIMSTMDTTELEKKIGLKTENIVSGENKAMGNPLTPEQRQILQAMVDEIYGMFVGLVAENRGLDLETAKKIADGRVYTANQAKELGLIDEIGTVEAIIEALRKDYGLEQAEVYDMILETTFWDKFFTGIGVKNTFSNEFQLIKKYIESSKSSKLMYY